MATFNQKNQNVNNQNNAETINVVQVKIHDEKRDSAGHQFEEKTQKDTSKISSWEKITGFIFGLVFVTALLTLAVVIPEPTPSQYATFKTVLAVAAAGVGGILAGFIHVEGTFQKLSLRSGGALALFIIVFFFTPAVPDSKQDEPAIKQTIESGGTGAIHTGEGNITIGK